MGIIDRLAQTLADGADSDDLIEAVEEAQTILTAVAYVELCIRLDVCWVYTIDVDTCLDDGRDCPLAESVRAAREEGQS